MDTSPAMRGNLYPTHLTARCPEFHACEFCKGCTKYNAHSIVCVNCESRKGPGLLCRHTDEHQHSVVRLNELFGKPIFHPDDTGSEVSFDPNGLKDWEEIANQIEDANRQG